MWEGRKTKSTYAQNKYLYKGKELQDNMLDGVKVDWYDYRARMYDAQLGRWHCIDPLVEDYFSETPYNYTGSNPISRIDVDGRSWTDGILEQIVHSADTAATNYVNKKVEQATDYVVESIKEAAGNTKVEAKAKAKETVKTGVAVNVKGVGGGAVSQQTSEKSWSASTSIGLDGDFNANISESENNDVKYEFIGNFAGNGVMVNFVEKENNETSQEMTVTTMTDIPGVQTETSLKLDSETGVGASFGVASGVEFPLPVYSDGVHHISVNLSIKLVYE